MKENISSKSTGLKDIRTLTGSSLLVAMSVIVDFFRIVISNILEISFGFAPIALGGAIYGPIVGGIIGGIADIIQYLVRSSGPFFPRIYFKCNTHWYNIWTIFIQKGNNIKKNCTMCISRGYTYNNYIDSNMAKYTIWSKVFCNPPNY